MDDENLQKSFETKKRNRTVMTGAQAKILKNYFQKNMFPSTEAREELAKILGMRPRTIQIWFQNQRQKTKSRYGFDRQHHEDDAVECKGLHALAEIASGLLDRNKDKSRIQR
ncbi:putative Homeodomain-like, Homeodomain-related, Homeobox protein [Trachipleistophora hominis]|uniref:Putative Homeodomain-like, Homeodomain-related, Homeobox protein n=1 Tax=Trachipleistophora hominis TaxID=72359 RepID=L7JX73_TRAHO|nr:putative Homeodomain-like, Homeodomain-related, Homeobox protein [Trachipleistophora hominis]